MNKEQIRWGIIGCGNVTEVKSGPAFKQVPHSALVAVMRRDSARAKDYAERHGVPKWYSAASELINDPEVDAVYIATPPLQHEAYTIETLRAGKPVYVEKPMAIDAAAAGRMAGVAKETGVKLSVAHYRRQQPLFLKIRSLLEENAIGAVEQINLQFYQPHQSAVIAQTDEPWRLNPAISGGGLFHDLAPHQLDLLLYFFGAPQKATGLSFNAAGFYEAPDTVAGQFIFQNTILFNGVWSFASSQTKDLCEITGSKGILRFSVFNHQPLTIIKDGRESHLVFDILPHVQKPMIEKVTAYFLDEASNPCSAEEGVTVLEMMEAITTATNL